MKYYDQHQISDQSFYLVKYIHFSFTCSNHTDRFLNDMVNDSLVNNKSYNRILRHLRRTNAGEPNLITARILPFVDLTNMPP